MVLAAREVKDLREATAISIAIQPLEVAAVAADLNKLEW
jgi:hypothetical protein